jgi:SAM-dependent methyltransferase
MKTANEEMPPPRQNNPAGAAPEEEAINASFLQASAARHNVCPEVHTEDMLMKFLLRHPGIGSQAGAVDYYFSDGARSARQLADLLHYLGGSQPPASLLEFACGYGCVTRHLPRVLEQTELTCSDIHPQAMQFLRQVLQVKDCRPSAPDPGDFRCNREFSVVFALSFFSHMPKRTWSRWLARLYGHLAPGGFLIFTTHGEASRKHFLNPVIPPDGFWFSETSEQNDLSTSDYGQTIVTLDFVRKAAAQAIGRGLHLYREAYWWRHQDLYVFQRPS